MRPVNHLFEITLFAKVPRYYAFNIGSHGPLVVRSRLSIAALSVGVIRRPKGTVLVSLSGIVSKRLLNDPPNWSNQPRGPAHLLIGFAGAFRRSELAAINCNDICTRESGVLIRIPRSKTDQEAEGRAVHIPRVGGLLCPVAALEQWLLISGITEGPLFRPVTKGGNVLPARISCEAIACILKNRVRAIGCDPSRYSGHSLRAGFATAAARLGVPLWRIRAQTGHQSDSMLERYIREAELS